MADQSIFSVTIPFVNPNEPIALIAALFIKDRQKISRGDVLCTLETTKSILDMVAERDGYIIGLNLKAGENVEAGETLCFIASSPDVKIGLITPSPKKQEIEPIEGLPAGLRITQPALALAKESSLDLSALPIGPLVTEAIVRDSLTPASPLKSQTSVIPSDPHTIIIYGSGGHGKTLLDLLRQIDKFHILGFVDDSRQKGEMIMDVPVLGGSQVLPELAAQGICQAVNAVGGIGNIQNRIQVFKRLTQAGFSFPTLVHPTAFVEPSARLSPGVQVFAHAYVGTQAIVGMGVIINTGAIISHDCQIADYANISPGALLAGEVTVGEATLVGMGVTVNLQVKIGKFSRIGNSAVVKKDVPDSGIVRAGSVWPEK